MSHSLRWSTYPSFPVRGGGTSSREPSSMGAVPPSFHDNGGWRGPGHLRPPAFPHWLRSWSLCSWSLASKLLPSSRLRSCTSFSGASFCCSASSTTLFAAATRSVASLSRIIASGALGAHANNPSAALLSYVQIRKPVQSRLQIPKFPLLSHNHHRVSARSSCEAPPSRRAAWVNSAKGGQMASAACRRRRSAHSYSISW